MIRTDCLTASATVESRDSRESQTTGAAKFGKPSGRSGLVRRAARGREVLFRSTSPPYACAAPARSR